MCNSIFYKILQGKILYYTAHDEIPYIKTNVYTALFIAVFHGFFCRFKEALNKPSAHIYCAVSFLVRSHETAAGILEYFKGVECNMTKRFKQDVRSTRRV